MKSQKILLKISVFSCCALVILTGCQRAGIPVLPDTPSLSSSENITDAHSPILWGYYHCWIDLENGTVEAVPDRQSMFTANVTNFINNQPAKLGFHIIDLGFGPNYVDFELDVSLTHPFPGMPQFDGYDVRGIFMGDGSASLSYGGGNLVYPVLGTDQSMTSDPEKCWPDGYTRWFNFTEFSTGGMPLLSYTHGKFGTENFDGTATLCPYMYFADGLGPTGDAATWLMEHPESHGVFSSGATNVREYYIRFPNSKGICFDYAIIANWNGVAPDDHPSNSVESPAIEVEYWDWPYYTNETDNGGDIGIDLTVIDWNEFPLSYGVMEDYVISIESPVLSASYTFDESDMTPVETGENTYKFRAEIEADNVTGYGYSEIWVIISYPGYDYSNDFGVHNLVENEMLTAFFRVPLYVAQGYPNNDPVCDVQVVTPMPAQGWGEMEIEFDASGSYDPDGDDLYYIWDFDGDGEFGDYHTGSPSNPIHTYEENYAGDVSVIVDDFLGGESECSCPVDITVWPNILFHWVGTSGSGDPMVGDQQWEYVPSAGVWDENGDITSMFTGCINSWVRTPPLDLPDESMGDFDIILKVVHWGGGNPPWLFEPNNDGFDTGGFIGYCIGWGTWHVNSELDPWLTYDSGNNFNAVSPMNLLVGTYPWCSVFPPPIDAEIWDNRAFGAMYPFGLWGSQSGQWTSEFKLDDSLKGESQVMVGFYYAGLEEDMGKANYPGWCISEVMLYVD